jgi:flagellar biogenesis protein FliO
MKKNRFIACRNLKPGCWMFFFALTAGAQTNFTSASPALPPLPDAPVTFLRVMGALALVIGLFLGGVWLFKNWQRLAMQRGRAPKLSVLECRSLGGRHAIYVIGYEQQRFLISSSPGGVNFLSHLPTGDPTSPESSTTPTFTQALAQAQKNK